MIRLTVNDDATSIDTSPLKPLNEVLREDLGLFGTKTGCAVGQCGACTVLIDGVPVQSCLTPVGKAAERDVTTIEGLQGDPTYETLARSFVEHGAIQCGFCTPGFLVAGTHLLRSGDQPDESSVIESLAGHLCRCTGYQKIREAFRVIDARPTDSSSGYVGSNVPRVDAWAKARGEAQYGADQVLPNTLHAVFVRSSLSHARILSVDISPALEVPGVVSALTAADVPGELLIGEIIKDTPVLAKDKVRFIGDPVAVVAAESVEAALTGVSAVEVEYEELPGVYSPFEALEDNTTDIHPTGNLMGASELTKGDSSAGLAKADVVIEGAYRTPRIEHAYLEPEAGMAYVDNNGVLVVKGCIQYPHSVHNELVRVTGLPANRIRVIQSFIGGAFGGKVDITVQAVIALLALRTGRPVQMVFDRRESISSTVKRHPFWITHRLGATLDGEIIAADIEAVNDTGAYALAGPIVLKRVSTHAAGAYEIPNVRTIVRAAYTNNVPSGAMRGFGLPQAIFATECQIDKLAAALEVDPIELRRRNALRKGSLTHTGQRIDHTALDRCLNIIQRFRDERREQIKQWNEPDHERGLGVAIMHYGLGYSGVPNPAIARITLGQDGKVSVMIGLVDVGQGSSTVFTQIAAHAMGVALSRIQLITEDTWLTDDPGPTSASRDTYFGGNAIVSGIRKLKETFIGRLADSMNLDRSTVEIYDDAVWSQGERIAAFQDACRTSLRSGSLSAKGVFDPDISLDDKGQGSPYPIYSFAGQMAEVDISLKTGHVRLIKLWAVHDSGSIVNPLGAEGQVEGGVAMALGNTLLEKIHLDNGEVLNSDLGGYVLPSIADTFDVETVFVDSPDPTGPFGAKGLGECSLLPTAPAIANAVRDAIGFDVQELPIDAAEITRFLRETTKH